MMKNLVTLIGIMTMFMLGITNYTVGNYENNYYYGNSDNSEYIRLHDEESVDKYVSSIFYNEHGNVVWNLDSEEL